MAESCASAKARLRADMLLRRRLAAAAGGGEAAGAQAVARVLALPEFEAARCVACYLATPGEVQTDAIPRACWRTGKSVCVPVFEPGAARYAWAELGEGDALRPGYAGIREPAQARPAPAAGIDLLLAPGVAFDARGGRLGRGRGFYDRMIRETRSASPAAAVIGLAFEFQMTEDVPADAGDEPVDAVVTERCVYRGRGGLPAAR